MAVVGAVSKSTGFFNSFKRFAYANADFIKYGLYRDDLLHEHEDVKEALRRLPAHLTYERTYRIIRASQLSLQKIYLPESEWITYDSDKANRYLQPYLDQVIKERLEKEQWDREH